MISKSNKIYAVCIVALLLSIFLGSTILDNLNTVIIKNEETYTTLVAIKDMDKAVIDMQSGARGYALNGNSAFLQPYYTGKSNYSLAYEKIKKYNFSDEEKSKLETANKAFIDWTNNVQLIIDKQLILENKVLAGDAKAASEFKSVVSQATKSSLQRKALIDSFSTSIQGVETEEKNKLSGIKESGEKNKNYTKATLFLGPIATILTVFYFTKILEQNEKDIALLNKDLEEIVKEKEKPKPKPRKVATRTRKKKEPEPSAPAQPPTPRPRGRPKKST